MEWRPDCHLGPTTVPLYQSWRTAPYSARSKPEQNLAIDPTLAAGHDRHADDFLRSHFSRTFRRRTIPRRGRSAIHFSSTRYLARGPCVVRARACRTNHSATDSRGVQRRPAWRAASALDSSAIILWTKRFVLRHLRFAFCRRARVARFAQPRLQTRYSALPASIIIGVLWSTWHLWYVITPGGFSNVTGANALATYVRLTSTAIIYAWMYNSTSRYRQRMRVVYKADAPTPELGFRNPDARACLGCAPASSHRRPRPPPT